MKEKILPLLKELKEESGKPLPNPQLLDSVIEIEKELMETRKVKTYFQFLRRVKEEISSQITQQLKEEEKQMQL